MTTISTALLQSVLLTAIVESENKWSSEISSANLIISLQYDTQYYTCKCKLIKGVYRCHWALVFVEKK